MSPYQDSVVLTRGSDSAPPPRRGHAAFVYSNEMFVYAGDTNQGHEDGFYVYTFGTYHAPLGPACSSSGVLPRDTVLWMRSLYLQPVGTRRWRQVTPVNTGPTSFEFCSAHDGEGNFYVFGGTVILAGTSKVTNDLWK